MVLEHQRILSHENPTLVD